VSVTFSKRRVLHGVSLFGRSAASVRHWCPMFQRLSLSPSAVDVMAVVFTCRAVGCPIPDRLGNRGPSCPTTDTRRTVGHLNSCCLSQIFRYHFFPSWKERVTPLWSSGQSSWQQIQRSRVRFQALPDFLRSSGSGTGSTQPREDN
jgi:hypothetical protein